MLSNAISVFADVFTSPSLNVNNRLQLFRHFQTHLNAAFRLKDSSPLKYYKMTNILLTTLGCLKKLNETANVITDAELIDIIRGMLEAVENSNFPLIKRIYSEAMIYLCNSVSDPQFTPFFIHEVERRVVMSEQNPSVKSSIVMLVGNMYKNFD